MKRDRIGHLCVCTVLLLPAAVAQAQTTWYVDDDAPLGGTGQTWDTAYRHLQDALSSHQPDDEIHVAGGTYVPDRDEAGSVTLGNRYETFRLHFRFSVRGGYRGLAGGGHPDNRDIHAFETILSGDLLGDDGPGFVNNDENSCRVVTCMATGVVLDGCTISGGNADDMCVGTFGQGGGILSRHSPTIRDCTFRGNSAHYGGGGMYNGNHSHPVITGCTFSENRVTSDSGYGGGAIYNYFYSDPVLIDCHFTGNTTKGTGGGAICNDEKGNPTLSNCTFIGNTASNGGGGMLNYNSGSDVVAVNCMFSGNSGAWGGGVYSTNSGIAMTNCSFNGNTASLYGGGICNGPDTMAVLINCILWKNTAPFDPQIRNSDPADTDVTYSCIEGGYPGGGNIDDDPLFVLGPAGCYYLSQTAAGQAEQSSCVDAGSDTAANLGLDTLTTRTDEATDTGTVDMGYHYPALGTGIVAGDLDFDGDVDLDDMHLFVAMLLSTDQDICLEAKADLNGDGAANGQDIQAFIELLV